MIVIYYSIGLYLILNTSITSDESAYVGAAYSYTQGLGLNREHPLFFKLINSLIINLFYPDYNLTIPPINFIRGEESIEARLAAFNLGYNLLMQNLNNFHKLLFSLRLPYLIFNGFIFFWLYLYTFIFKKIPDQVSLVFTILFVFSPSLYSHNFLIAFDVSVAVYAVLSILTLMVIYETVIKGDSQFFLIHFLVFSFCLLVAINSKFSNLILLPITIGTYIFIGLYLFKNQKSKRLINFLSLSLLSLIIQATIIILMYGWAFRYLAESSLMDKILIYIDGINMTLSTSTLIREPFWNGQFVSMTSLGYLSKIFWFKENPGLLIMGLFLGLILVYKISSQKIVIKDYINKQTLPLIILGSAYPLIYFLLIQDSRNIIGYRYFYPVILFVYLLMASSTLLLKHKWQQYVLITILTIYMYFGVVGIPQSLSYVNPLWQQEKWKLADDSTINWGQETKHGVNYLLKNNLLPKDNHSVITHHLFGVNIGFVQYLDLLSQQNNYPINIQSYYAQPQFDPKTDKISEISANYLFIDSTTKQTIYAQKEDNPIAAENWNLLRQKQPIYARNDIIFIYRIN
ncbi:hypothetical protein [Cyanothece sp. BG0011]|uniref:hypothetical protein n=1 Tax=Cyanothece sp. BG0011 TaxID=2082950 RepID=UPI0018E52918|nr:hypothetical protein [Cyanothece sp. BG0011]